MPVKSSVHHPTLLAFTIAAARPQSSIRPRRSMASFTPLCGCGGVQINGLFHFGEQAVAKIEHIVRYSAKDLAGKRERGETRSDCARAAAMTEEEIESDVATDPNEAGMVVVGIRSRSSCLKRRPTCICASTAMCWTFFARRDAAIKPASMRCCAPMSRGQGAGEEAPSAAALSSGRIFVMPTATMRGSASGPPKAASYWVASPAALPASIGREGFRFRQLGALGPG